MTIEVGEGRNFIDYFKKTGDYILSKDKIRNYRTLNQLAKKHDEHHSLGQRIYDAAGIAFNSLFRYGGLYLIGDAVINADLYDPATSLIGGFAGVLFTLYSVGESKKQTKDVEQIEQLEKSVDKFIAEREDNTKLIQKLTTQLKAKTENKISPPTSKKKSPGISGGRGGA